MTTVWTFFYGSYINLDVLAEVDYVPDRYEVARLPGFDIVIGPLANLVRSDSDTVFGILATCTHADLERLYAHASEVLGGAYLPEAIVAYDLHGAMRPALCYISPKLPPAPASNEYVDRIVKPARELGFPDWYVARLESFRPVHTG